MEGRMGRWREEGREEEDGRENELYIFSIICTKNILILKTFSQDTHS